MLQPPIPGVSRELKARGLLPGVQMFVDQAEGLSVQHQEGQPKQGLDEPGTEDMGGHTKR